MKNKLILIISVTFIFLSCKKESTNPPVNTPTTSTVKFDFSSNIAAQYSISYKVDTTQMGEDINAQLWTKTVTTTRTTSNRLTKLTVYPPVAWVGTNTQANVNLKITVDGVVKKDTAAILLGLDRSSGISIQTTY